mmetsp:Transcript_53117/g.168610  ORF Transcript_53117/g.168610 Transcript_53117/m.168610 type:complete len:258 (-) Transcript_53117:1953-2726(-)
MSSISTRKPAAARSSFCFAPTTCRSRIDCWMASLPSHMFLTPQSAHSRTKGLSSSSCEFVRTSSTPPSRFTSVCVACRPWHALPTTATCEEPRARPSGKAPSATRRGLQPGTSPRRRRPIPAASPALTRSPTHKVAPVPDVWAAARVAPRRLDDLGRSRGQSWGRRHRAIGLGPPHAPPRPLGRPGLPLGVEHREHLEDEPAVHKGADGVVFVAVVPPAPVVAGREDTQHAHRASERSHGLGSWRSAPGGGGRGISR